MDPSVLKFIHKLGDFTEEESFLIAQEVLHKTYKKNDLLLRVGEVCSSLCYIISGSFYHFKMDTDLNENVMDLGVEHDWIINHQSFTSRKPSEYDIKAYEDSSILELTIDSIHKLIGVSQSFLKMGVVLQDATARMTILNDNNTPDLKYKYLLKNKPQIIQKFPQKIIASYLNITPETLSRVRKRLK
ncbi:Crp/Fnr family transcriptional regulator [Aquimarina sp. 433]